MFDGYKRNDVIDMQGIKHYNKTNTHEPTTQLKSEKFAKTVEMIYALFPDPTYVLLSQKWNHSPCWGLIIPLPFKVLSCMYHTCKKIIFLEIYKTAFVLYVAFETCLFPLNIMLKRIVCVVACGCSSFICTAT